VLKGYSNWIGSVIATPVPEPESGELLLLGVASLFGLSKRRSKSIDGGQGAGNLL